MVPKQNPVGHRSREIREQEIKLLTIEKEQHNVLKSAQVLICDSESKLADAIKHDDMDQVSVAHGLLEIARKRTATATTELRVVAQKRQKCADTVKPRIEAPGFYWYNSL